MYFLLNRTTLQIFVTYLTGSWIVVLLNKKYIYSYLKCIVYDKLLKVVKDRHICIFLFNRTTLQAPIKYVTKTWSIVLLNTKYIYSYLKCIVYDKLLKPRQSF